VGDIGFGPVVPSGDGKEATLSSTSRESIDAKFLRIAVAAAVMVPVAMMFPTTLSACAGVLVPAHPTVGVCRGAGGVVVREEERVR
jgi:hypothetical protein